MARPRQDPREKLVAALADRFLKALQDGNEEAGLKTVEAALTDGLDGPSIYLHIFQPAMEQVGHQWETGQLGVGDEHRATELTRWLMSSLWDEFTPKRSQSNNVRVLSGCAQGERHDLGLLMVAHFLRRDGWHITNLGADVPEREFARMAERIQPGICLISAATPDCLETVRATITELHRSVPQAPTLVGGLLFREYPDLAAELGATTTAADAAEAVVRVQQLLHGS